jgi:DNA ligase D-like protein (predicted ligase)
VAVPFTARFIEPMLLEPTSALPEGPSVSHEVKLDGYRAIAFKSNGRVSLRSRNKRDFNGRYPAIVRALSELPDETVVDGEVVALDDAGRPSFNALQNVGSAPIVYYVFDIMVLRGRAVMAEPLAARRELLGKHVLPRVFEPVRELIMLNASLKDLIAAVRAQGLEGLVAKRLDSRYEPGRRSGAWQKMRLNQGQEFVIGGYSIAARYFDALVFGYFEGQLLKYAGRTRSGFTPATRAKFCQQFRGLEIPNCPFVNLPERSGRWGQGLTAEKMKDCRWLAPQLVGRFEFVEWTPDNHLRHVKFIGLRDDVDARDVRRES